jgi:hypothetical protein
VTVLEREIRRVDVEAIDRTAASDHAARQRPLPVDGERLAIESSQQLEVDRLRLQRDVLHDQDWATDAKGHLPAQA